MGDTVITQELEGKELVQKFWPFDQLQAAQHHIDLIQKLKIRSRDHKLILKA